MKLIGALQLINFTVPILFHNGIPDGCQTVMRIEHFCDQVGQDHSGRCIAKSMDLLGEDNTVTMDKFLNEFVKQHTVNQTAFEIFAATARKCGENEVKHEPISDSEVWNLLECMLIPANELENAFGCKFPHPL